MVRGIYTFWGILEIRHDFFLCNLTKTKAKVFFGATLRVLEEHYMPIWKRKLKVTRLTIQLLTSEKGGGHAL